MGEGRFRRTECLLLAVLALTASACGGGAGSLTAKSTPTAASVVPSDPCGAAGVTLYLMIQVSMEPTLEPGDQLVVGPATDAAGEIVVFAPPPAYQVAAQNIPWIKRVVGVGGDNVELKNGAVWVNGAQISEPYVYQGQLTEATAEQTVWQVPTGHLFVLGDHREASQDSRTLGPIAVGSVIGRVTYRCLPAASRGPIG